MQWRTILIHSRQRSMTGMYRDGNRQIRFLLPGLDRTAGAIRAGRPIRVKVHGKKREHGRHSYDFGREAVIPFRYRCGLPVYCVQSRRARRNARMFGY